MMVTRKSVALSHLAAENVLENYATTLIGVTCWAIGDWKVHSLGCTKPG
jgi:hypothetical protein